MTIAIVAWSPLANAPGFRTDGPLLPIELAMQSQERLIPVLCGEPWVRDVRTLWITSRFDQLDPALSGWAAEEGVAVTEIGYVTRQGFHDPDTLLDSLDVNDPLRDRVVQRLQTWREHHNFDAVIWRDSRANRFQGQTIKQAKEWVHNNFDGYPEYSSQARYIGTLPTQVSTVIREYTTVAFNWALAPLPEITTGDDLRFEDWQECRKTIGRFDTILEDLRKFGFSLVTSLLTASAFLSFLGISNTPPPTSVRAVVFITVMVLVTALFSVDTYYGVLLSGAVERALDLEKGTKPPIRVTKYLSVNATRSGISFAILALYIVLLATAGGMGLFAVIGSNNQAVACPCTFWRSVVPPSIGIAVIGVIVAGVAACRAYHESPSLQEFAQLVVVPFLVVVVIGPAVTIFLASGLLNSSLADPSAVWCWIVLAGTFLALYIQYYWFYCAWRSGLYRHKRGRNWPEGNEKEPRFLMGGC
jgi:hypothetical protein